MVRRRSDWGAAAGPNGGDRGRNSDTRARSGIDTARSRSVSASGAVGDGGSARSDGHILSGVDSLDRRGNGEAGEESKGGNGETHFDGIEN